MRDSRVWIGGLTLAAVCGLAIACPPGECEDSGEVQASSNVWFGAFGDEPAKGELSTAVVGDGGVWVTGPDGVQPQADVINESIQVIIENGKTRVIRNGKELSEDEISELHDRLPILGGARGDANFQVRVAPSVGQRGELALRTRVVGPDDAPTAVMKMQPKVMVGITMAEPDESLRAHLGIGDREVIMLDGVIEGLPAANAGLKKWDIIIGIDDSDDNVTAEHLHEVLMKKQPGDELRLRVLRGGQKETYRVKLSAYDAKTLGIESAPHTDAVVVGDRQLTENKAEHIARLKEMTDRLRETGIEEEKIAAIQKQVEQAMRQALESADEAVKWRANAARDGQQFDFVVPGPDGRMLELKMPDMKNMQVPDALRDRLNTFRGDSADMERRMADLERRMDEVSARLEERMDRALRRFEEMTDRLDRRLREGGN